MNRRELYTELEHIHHHIKHLERVLGHVLARVGIEFEMPPPEEIPAPEYPSPAEYPFEEPENLREWDKKVREKGVRGGIDTDELYQDTTALMLENWRTSNALLSLFTRSASQITLKSQCPQCGGHLVLRVDESKREIYLTCLDRAKGAPCNRVWTLAHY